MKIDVFSHFLPKRYVDALGIDVQAWTPIWLPNTPLCQIDARLDILDRNPDVTQIINIATPPLETLVTPVKAIELAKIANDEMAEIVHKYPKKFLSAVACLPLSDIDASIKEAERAITELHFCGVQIFTNINGEPLDSPKFKPLYKRLAQFDLPIWIHPWLNPKPAAGDLHDNPVLGLGWPFETTMAMGCLAQSEIFEDYPDIKFITHHCGGMVPFFSRRIAMSGWKRPAIVTVKERTRVVANFHKFFADTAVYGNSAALMCGLAYFGIDHLVFGTDTPLGGEADSNGEYRCTQETIRSIEQMNISSKDKKKIFELNTLHLLKIKT